MKVFIDLLGSTCQYDMNGGYTSNYIKKDNGMNIQSSYLAGTKMIILSLNNFTGVGVYPTFLNVNGVSNI